MSGTALHHLRAGAGVAALALAVLSRGDALSLALLLTVLAWRPVSLCVLPALVASSWRWGSTSLQALAGAQGVLGPAVVVGPASAAAASALAGAAILLGVPGRPVDGASQTAQRLLPALATGAAVAAVVAGAAPGGDVWARVVVGAAAAAAAAGCGALRLRGPRWARVLDGSAVAAGLGALVAASRSAPGWAGTVDGGAFGEGAAIAVAAVGLVSTVSWAVAAMRHRRA